MEDFERNEYGNPVCYICGEELTVFVGSEPGDIQAICPICDGGE